MDSTGTGGIDTTVASVKITPGGVLLTGNDESQVLSAKAYNATGQALSVSSITWASNKPTDVDIDASGTVTSFTPLGSAFITATVDGVTSAPVLVTIAQPVAGAVLVNDSQVVGDIRPTNPALPLTVGSLYDVTLIGVTAPAIGDILIGTGESPVGGRAVSTSTQGGYIVVTLEFVTLDELFSSYNINETMPLSMREALINPSIASSYNVVHNPDGSITFTPLPAAPASVKAAAVKKKVGIGPFECETVLAAFPLELKVSPTFTITPTFDYIVQLSSSFQDKKVSVEGGLSTEAAISWALTSSINGQVTCEVELLEVPLPIGGALSLFLGGYVPMGLGAEIGGSLALNTMSFEVKAKAGGAVKVGVLCPAGGSCSPLTDFKSESSFDTTWTPPASTFSNALRLTPGLSGYGFANVEMGLRYPKNARLQVLSFKGGLSMGGTLALVDGQVEDLNFASDYKLSIEATLGPGSSITDFLRRLKLNYSGAGLTLSIPLSESPKAVSVTADVASFLDGDTVNFGIQLDPKTIEYLATYNVKEVQVYRKTVDVFGGVIGELVGTAPATAGQTDFFIPWTANFNGDITDNINGVISENFYAFVVTKFLPFPYFDSLELGGVEVRCVASTTPPSLPFPPLQLPYYASCVPPMLAFASNGTFSHIFVVNEDGSNQTNLTNITESSWDPVWSPDGTMIAFVSSRFGWRNIFVMNADGTNQQRISTTAEGAFDLSWSPDSTAIAFKSHDQIYTISPNGSNPAQLTNNLSTNALPVWSPDSTKIAYVSSIFGSGYYIYVMNANGTNQQALAFSPDTDPIWHKPVWSPDGTKIAYGTTSTLFTTNADGSNPVAIVTSTSMGAHDWSPDGTMLTYSSEGNIHVINADGTSPTQLTNNTQATVLFANPTWSPDGTKIAFLSGDFLTLDIFVMNSDGSNMINVTNSTAQEGAPVWQP